MFQIKVSVPGKLYIAGEYAVVTPGHLATLMTVDRLLTVTIDQVDGDIGSLLSTNYSPQPFEWKREDGVFQFVNWANPYHLLEEVIQTVESYLKAIGKDMLTYNVKIHSDLDMNGQKIGLGSSGAVTIAMVKGLLELYQVAYDDLLAYKLGVLAHMKMKSVGSFGDLAACSYTGVISYACFDRNWLETQISQTPIDDLAHQDWPKLHIKQIQWPQGLEVLVGWTGSPASTEDLVSTVYQDADQLDFEDFLDKSHTCNQNLVQSLELGQLDQVLDLISENRKLLNQMGQAKDKLIETPKLTQLVEIANRHGASGKSSGAGGGDCGIALVKDSADKADIINDWQAAHIKALDLNIYQNGDCDG